MLYKAIISDIDGTLTKRITNKTSKPLPSERVTELVKEVNKKIPFILATSRPLALVSYLLDFLQLHRPCITLNGALIIESKTKNVLLKTPINDGDFEFITNYLEKRKYSFIVDEEIRHDIPFTKKYQFQSPLNVFVSELTEKEAKKIEKDFDKRSTINAHRVFSWSDNLWGLNISNANVSKQHAILEVARILNIFPDEIIGIGDGYNDFPLLEACGLKIAMGNAVPELKEIANYIAPSIEDDGVADVIERFILSS